MSKKIEVKLNPEESPSRPGRAIRYFEKFQDPSGSETLNPISLVAAVNMKPLTIGERLARFTKSPIIDPSYGYDELDDGLDENVDPMSPYEDRAHALLRQAAKKRAARQKVLNEKQAEEEREKMAILSKKLEAIRTAASQPPAPPEPPKKPKG